MCFNCTLFIVFNRLNHVVLSCNVLEINWWLRTHPVKPAHGSNHAAIWRDTTAADPVFVAWKHLHAFTFQKKETKIMSVVPIHLFFLNKDWSLHHKVIGAHKLRDNTLIKMIVEFNNHVFLWHWEKKTYLYGPGPKFWVFCPERRRWVSGSRSEERPGPEPRLHGHADQTQHHLKDNTSNLDVDKQLLLLRPHLLWMQLL